ncbi:histidine phosphatase family protein [Cytobacillus massiliigabonensis]|uniref:histidine phosphatase family protein n=1 Tax=Cytobacillus massiliigabonensis TaxID=1871011 RepID=UPI000C835062|nr:histidine phosphatase family protein [Cytobacillus massiliigabonensis]
MEISLIRHGKSKQIENNRLSSQEFQNWVKKYDESGVFEEDSYPEATLGKAEAASLLVTSDLKRSIESASLLHQQKRVISDSLFREAELPVLSGTWRIRLSPNCWAIFLRCLWYSGYARQCESLANARQRAERAAIQLVKHAEEHHSVVLVGHGFFNRLIAVELKKMGWKGNRKISAKHWNCATYSFYTKHS